MQVEITNDASAVAFAHYDTFEIEEVGTDYKLVVGGFRTVSKRASKRVVDVKHSHSGG